MTHIKPFLKWAGSKYSCLNHILSNLPKSSRLIEPFTGSAAVFVNAEYDNYLLADGNPDLINLFMQLKKGGGSFIEYCAKYFKPLNNDAIKYYKFRTKFNALGTTKERAALFLYLNRHGYNGLCRYNQQGIYNVPFGRYTKPYFPKQELEFFYQKCQKAELIHCDFKETFAMARPGDLIYCDPPYVPLSSTAFFSAYTKTKFGEKEQIILAELAREGASRGITVIISNHDTEFTREQYRDSVIKSFEVQRRINCKTEKRGPVKELIAIFQ